MLRDKTAASLSFAARGTKQADIGGEQETGFEQAFSSLAYAYLRDKAPRLLDYVVGFQLVDRNDDNSKAVGVFGFKVGKQWLYAPVFFLNGSLKGHELLYIKNRDMFIPLKENWVNYVMSRKPHVLGEGSQKDVFQLGGLAPNFDRITWPPTNSKFGSWHEDALPLLAAGITKSARFLYREADHGRTLDLQKVAAAPLAAAVAGLSFDLAEALADPGLHKAARAAADKYPLIRAGFERFHPGLLARVPAETKTGFDILAGRTSAPDASGGILGRAPAAPTVTIKTAEEAGVLDSDEDKEKLLRHGYLVRDERTGEQVSIAYATDEGFSLSNPSSTGLYDVLEKPGKFNRMLVLAAPYTNGGTKDFAVVVRTSDPRRWANAHRTALFARDVEDAAAFRKLVDGLPGKDSLAVGGTYLAIDGCGEGTTPFTVRKSLGDGRYEVNFSDYASFNFRGLPAARVNRSLQTEGEYISSYGALLILNDRPGCKLRALRGELHVPSDFKFLTLEAPASEKERADDHGTPVPIGNASQSTTPPIELGSLVDVERAFYEKTASLKLVGDHNEVVIKTQKRGAERLSWQGGLFALVKHHGFREDTAAAMLKAAQARGGASYRVKYAEPYPFPGPGPTAPTIPAPQRGTEPMGYNSVQAIYPQEEHIPVPGLEASLTDPRVYDPFLPDRGAMGVAQQAAQDGQKDVFDTAMLSGMLKAVRQDSLVDKYLGDLMKALDKLGRILFVFYYHQDDFADRYGKADMPELEDSLRNTFETLGDTLLFLKEKSIEPGLSDQDSEPNIEEAAQD